MSRPPEERDLEQEILVVEQNLLLLKERYSQVKQDQQRLAQLKESQQNLSSQANPETLTNELTAIKKEIETLELRLESSLFSWDSLKEPFWQAVRFGGLGIVIGWLMKSYAG